jgi:hypothetical protein
MNLNVSGAEAYRHMAASVRRAAVSDDGMGRSQVANWKRRRMKDEIRMAE